MEDKDFEEWVKEETLKRISEFKKENPKLFPNGETNNKWDKYIEWSVRTKERGFRAGVEFGKKENKVELKSYRETVDAMVTENEEWQKKVEELKEGTIQLKKKAYIDLSSDAYEEWMKAYIDFGNLINSIFKTNNIKSEGNRMEE